MEIISATLSEKSSASSIFSASFSGILKAQVGYILLAEQQGEIISIPLKKFTGRKIRILPEIIELNLPERQASLFDF